jgi:mono/diheme cytochrome c family protein
VIRRFPASGWLIGLLALTCSSCADGAAISINTSLDFPGATAGKSDAFGRQLAGIAAPYAADYGLSIQEASLKSDMAFRRQVAWNIVERVIDPVPLLGLAAAEEATTEILLPGGVPEVPRFQTWYGVDDFKRMFKKLYGDLAPEERAQRLPFTEQALADVVDWNATAADRSERWPLERFLKHVKDLDVCPPGMDEETCANSLQSNFSGASAGNARITYSPGTMLHLLRNYASILGCLEGLKTLSIQQAPDDEDSNFSYCFESEFPPDAVLIKAQWVRADFDRPMPAYDTDAAALINIIGGGKSADWAEGDRQLDPTADEVFTIRLRNKDTYRLAGLHIMTKELRHWMWITLWWSDKPDVDFGADRPASFGALDPVWSRYKMAVTVDYEEGDPNPGASFTAQPTLAEVLNATAGDGFTWSSNPYIEHGRGNARTNCVGCHQHGGSEAGYDLDDDGTLDPFDLEMVIDNETLFPGNGRARMRSMFPSDYLWSTHRIDNLGQLVKSEVGFFDSIDQNTPEVRAVAVLALEPSVLDGEALFKKHCTPCHGSEGTGTASGPSHFERVPNLTDFEIALTLINGKSPMPSWAALEDQNLADLRAYLRFTFHTAAGEQ